MWNKKLIIGILSIFIVIAWKIALAAPSIPKYTTKSQLVQMRAGVDTIATLRIVPNKGFKFNKDYPSKFIVASTQHVKCNKCTLTKKSGNVKTVDKVGVVSIPLSAIMAGLSNIAITGSFSVCNNTSCHILRGQRLSLPVIVRSNTNRSRQNATL
jgi:hypothetical protein